MADQFDRAYTAFLDELAAFLTKYKKASGKYTQAIALDTRLAHGTVSRFESRETRNPHTYTTWKLLRELDCEPASFSGKFRKK